MLNRLAIVFVRRAHHHAAPDFYKNQHAFRTYRLQASVSLNFSCHRTDPTAWKYAVLESHLYHDRVLRNYVGLISHAFEAAACFSVS